MLIEQLRTAQKVNKAELPEVTHTVKTRQNFMIEGTKVGWQRLLNLVREEKIQAAGILLLGGIATILFCRSSSVQSSFARPQADQTEEGKQWKPGAALQ